MRHLFVIDPIERLDPARDTTIAFLREAGSRGHRWSLPRPPRQTPRRRRARFLAALRLRRRTFPRASRRAPFV